MSTTSHSVSRSSFPLTPPSQSGTDQQSKMAFQLPQTPQSPSQPSLQSVGKPSPTDMSRQSANSTLPTPAHSVNGSTINSSSADVPMTSEFPAQSMDVNSEDILNKRKREAADSGDRESKKIHVEDRRLGIEDLHLDVGEKYLLCRTPHPRTQPDLTKDLFAMYSLNDVAAKVARVLPNGEKNGLRKTYKGKIKDLGISGKFDVTVHGEESEKGLFAMMSVPEIEWDIQHRVGSEIEKGLSTDVKANLAKAMTMSRGLIPKSSWDSSVLGEMDLPEKKVAAPPAPARMASGAAQRGPTSVPQRAVSGDITRPKRKIKQRSYGDSSFEGYGDGYVDDDMVDAGYSTGEGDDGSQKRRKKNASSPNHNYPGPMRHNSYGPGMVGA